ncbi:MAG: tRNA (N6-threonylcarbamoyladenosine(37)-N6)-methyltransferase TrmO [Hyphomicrobiales bacterium]|nr:tRNA (N6-threonylcarbamoyladenosine(37)-N6)-methyltransferase TrmO [Hyphomicrobiales bacterium]MBV9974600.1 tRNA (N6-threonylcarbamoyladenosine(37)-N6)-methyltransferase TrmO [Hyphomicrobiales bacterium]
MEAKRVTGNEELRPGEAALSSDPTPAPAVLYFIGSIFTPWTKREECPRQGAIDGPLCRVEVAAPWLAALAGIESFERLQLLYWMHLSRRDLVLQNPRGGGDVRGTFALRSPLRPNPIASSLVALERVEGASLFVRGLDCISGTPLIDIKPEHCPRA